MSWKEEKLSTWHRYNSWCISSPRAQHVEWLVKDSWHRSICWHHRSNVLCSITGSSASQAAKFHSQIEWNLMSFMSWARQIKPSKPGVLQNSHAVNEHLSLSWSTTMQESLPMNKAWPSQKPKPIRTWKSHGWVSKQQVKFLSSTWYKSSLLLRCTPT